MPLMDTSDIKISPQYANILSIDPDVYAPCVGRYAG